MNPVPLPVPGSERLGPPDRDEVRDQARGVFAAVRPSGGYHETQRLLLHAAFAAMTGHDVDGVEEEDATATDFAAGLADRNLAYRSRVVQTMLLGALVLRPLPRDVADRVCAYATAVGVDDPVLDITRHAGQGDLAMIAVDFDRNGYSADWSPDRAAALHTSETLESPWAASLDDSALAERWDALATLPDGTLGQALWQFYRARGFESPGRPGSAPPLLAQHDWVHVLADYGTTVESELEVFAFIARANDDPRGFSLLAMVVSLFETGYLDRGAGLFEAFPGQLSRVGMTTRVADAMRRGALSHGLGDEPDVDFLALDWFALADRPLDDLRAAFGLVAKSDDAVAAGSVGPWEPGGISPFQEAAGQRAAVAAGREYESYGATSRSD